MSEEEVQEPKVKLRKHEEQKIDTLEPWSDDHLERAEAAETLGHVLLSIEQPFVVAINSPFGTGKSFFVNRLIQDFKNKNHVALYFNAWEKDNHGQPLLSFVGELQKQLEGYGIKKDRKVVKNVVERAGSLFLRKGIPAAARIATAGVVGDEDIKDLGQFGAELISGAGSLAEGLVQRQIETEAAFSDFRTDLETLAAEALKKVGGKAKSIYVFIDELDRCRPPYALELLENIKHLFSVQGMVFVLAIDRDHLKNSISTIYGSGMDSDGYLARFIDQNYSLPDASPEAYVQYLSKRFGLAEAVEQRREGQGQLKALQKGFSDFSRIFNLSLRHQEQAMAEVNFIFRKKPVNTHLSTPLIGMMAVLKRAIPSVYEDYCKGILHWDDLEQVIKKQPNGQKWLADKETLLIRAWLLVGNYNDISKLIVNQNQIIERLNLVTNTGTPTEELQQERKSLDAKNNLFSKGIEVARFLSKYDLMDGTYTKSPVGIVYEDFNLARDYGV